MAVESLDLETYFGKCKCCLNYGYLRTMWEQHVVDGETEVYGNMLTECFAVTWTIQQTEAEDQICEKCIWKLREALKFKKQLLECQKAQSYADNDDILEDIKPEAIELKQSDEEYEEEYLEEDLLDQIPKEEVDEETLGGGGSEKESSDEQDYQDGDDEDFDATEYQEEDDDDFEPSQLVARKRSRRTKRDGINTADGAPRNKYKRLPENQRYRTYKMYADETMDSAVEAVVSRRMTQPEAAKYYNVPRKTLSSKINSLADNVTIQRRSYNYRALCDELKLFLTYTNATPFLSKPQAGTTRCFYCRETFVAPQDLRAHTLTHPNRNKNLQLIMRPVRKYRIVKLDIQHAACTACDLKFDPDRAWEHMTRHLSSDHGGEMTQSHRIIPYNLGDEGSDSSCVFCPETFTAIKTLDSHMNTHYNNYICEVCGDKFLTDVRLRAHENTHDDGRHPCPECNKMFSRQSYMKKHLESLHKMVPKFKCRYCNDKFRNENSRHTHVVEKHYEHVQIITCELCGAVYNSLKNFVRHMKTRHGKGKESK